jgi:TPR repeat protein
MATLGVELSAAQAYNVACIFARLAETAEGDARESDAQTAMTWLKKAAATGYPANARQIEHVQKTDEDLAALRSRPDFQEWAKSLTPTKK